MKTYTKKELDRFRYADKNRWGLTAVGQAE